MEFIGGAVAFSIVFVLLTILLLYGVAGFVYERALEKESNLVKKNRG